AEMLRADLVRLKEDRPRISKEIEVAREHGALSENAEYHAAHDRQGLNEARARGGVGRRGAGELSQLTNLRGRRVVPGAQGTLLNLDTTEETRDQIVGLEEADIESGLISFDAPVARALIGKSSGDEVTVKRPGGVRHYEISDVEYG